MLWDAIGDDKSVNSTDTAKLCWAMPGMLNVCVVSTINSLQQCKLPAAQSDAKSFFTNRAVAIVRFVLANYSKANCPTVTATLK